VPPRKWPVPRPLLVRYRGKVVLLVRRDLPTRLPSGYVIGASLANLTLPGHE
jgi:hypothetical protein